MNQTQFAKRHGCSRQYIGQLVSAGEISIVNGLIDTDENDTVMSLKKTNKSKNCDPDIKTLKLELMKAQLKNIKHRCDLLETKVKKETGELVLLKDVEKEAFETARVVRNNLLNVPDRVSAQLIGQDAATIHKILTTEFRQALGEIGRGE